MQKLESQPRGSDELADKHKGMQTLLSGSSFLRFVRSAQLHWRLRRHVVL